MEAIVIILWSVMSLLVMIQYAPYCKNLNPTDQMIVGIIFLVGGPFFTIANVLESLLDCFLPEGWGNE